MAGVTDPLLLVPFAASVALTNKQAVAVELAGCDNLDRWPFSTHSR